jgi:tetratricopeptide (TPR) repeat protein
MIKKPFLFIFVSLLILATSVGAASAQSSKEAEGRIAEQAGKLREALTHYVAALQNAPEGSTVDQRLRETIIKLVQRLSPAPAVPEEAERYMGRGQAAVEIAKSPEDFKRAAGEFQKALRIAPWLANGYYNLGILQEKAGQLVEAMRSYKLYLLAAPSAPDAQQVRTRIFGLEYKAEREKEAAAKAEQQRLARQREEEERSARQRPIAGDWYDRADPTQEHTIRYQVTIAGNNVEIRPTWMYVRESNYAREPSWVPYRSTAAPPVWRGTIDGLTITGTFYGDNSYWEGGTNYTRPMSGSISPDGKTLRLQYKAVGPRGRVVSRLVERWEESEQFLDLIRH